MCLRDRVAHIALPVRYTLWVLAVFTVLAALFWRTRQLRRFVPVGFVCAVAAVMLGSTMQRDVVRLAMVGTCLLYTSARNTENGSPVSPI